MIAPTEASELRRNALHTDYWLSPAIEFERGKEFGCEELLDLCTERCFADPSWPENQNQGIWRYLMNRI